ncbi:hypothetical protein M0R45_006197 [Rubus argutus]
MHEYRLDERECETAQGLQDAYGALPYFKRLQLGPKRGEHYGSTSTTTNYQLTSDHSSSVELYSEGRCDQDFESSGYNNNNNQMAMNIPCSSNLVHTSSSPSLDHMGRKREGKWTQFLSKDSFNSLSSFPNQGAIPYPPSKVDIALECARLQHRLTLPPLEVGDFPHAGFTDFRTLQYSNPGLEGTSTETDALQEILSVAHVSQEMISQSNNFTDQTWGTAIYAPGVNDFSFMVDRDAHYNQITTPHDMNPMRYVDKPWENSYARSIEIGDLDDDDFRTENPIENLRWIGMSDKDLEKSFTEEHKIVPIENIASFQREEQGREVQGDQSEHHSGMIKEFNDSDETNDFSLGFINDDPDENFLHDGNIDTDYSPSPSFEVIEEIQVNHGMFVSTRQVAETFFHQLMPSQTVKVHLNPVLVHSYLVERVDNMQAAPKNTRGSFFESFKEFAMEKFVGVTRSSKPWRKIVSAIVCAVTLFLMHTIYVGEHMEDEKLMDTFTSTPTAAIVMKEEGNSNIISKKKKKVCLVNIRGGSSCSVFLKKIGIFLTVSLALCTMWANHNIITC